MKLWIAAAACAAGLMFAGTDQAKAEVFYPWCAHYGKFNDGGGSGTCGYTSYRQCLATVSGTGGYCARNPFYQQPEVYRERPRRRHRRVIVED